MPCQDLYDISGYAFPFDTASSPPPAYRTATALRCDAPLGDKFDAWPALSPWRLYGVEAAAPIPLRLMIAIV